MGVGVWMGRGGGEGVQGGEVGRSRYCTYVGRQVHDDLTHWNKTPGEREERGERRRGGRGEEGEKRGGKEGEKVKKRGNEGKMDGLHPRCYPSAYFCLSSALSLRAACSQGNLQLAIQRHLS